MTETTDHAARRNRYAEAIRETDGWVLDGGQHTIDAVIAVADAEQADLRTANERMRHELEVMYGGAFDSLPVAAATVPAPAPTDFELRGTGETRAAALIEAADFLRDAHFDEGLSVQEIGTAMRHWADRERADAASGPGRVAGETQQPTDADVVEAHELALSFALNDAETQQPLVSTADKAAALGLTDTEYRARSHAAAVATVRAAIPGMYAHVGFRVEDVLNEAGETQQPETQADDDTARLAKVTRWVTSEVVTAKTEFGDGYRAAQRDIRDLVKGRFDYDPRLATVSQPETEA